MGIQEFKEKVSGVATSDKVLAEFYFITKEDSGRQIYKADVESSAQKEMTVMFTDSLITKVLMNEELSLVKFSKSDNRSNTLYEYDLKNPVEFDYFYDVLANKEVPLFNFSKNSFSEITGMVVLLADHKQQLALYKHFYSVALLKKGGSVFNLGNFGDKNRLEKLPTDVIKINSGFDMLVVDNKFYINKVEVFEKFFGLDQVIINTAKLGIDEIEKSDLVVDSSVLNNRLSKTAFARKLIRVSKGSPVLGVVSNENIIKFAKKHPYLKGKIKFNKNETKIDLDTKVSQDYFLKLLNDDYLHSQLTNSDYVSLAKDNLSEGLE